MLLRTIENSDSLNMWGYSKCCPNFKFKEKINSMGIWGGLLLFGLELLQIVLVILPAEPLEILAGMCYGPIGGTLSGSKSSSFLVSFVVLAFLFC